MRISPPTTSSPICRRRSPSSTNAGNRASLTHLLFPTLAIRIPIAASAKNSYARTANGQITPPIFAFALEARWQGSRLRRLVPHNALFWESHPKDPLPTSQQLERHHRPYPMRRRRVIVRSPGSNFLFERCPPRRQWQRLHYTIVKNRILKSYHFSSKRVSPWSTVRQVRLETSFRMPIKLCPSRSRFYLVQEYMTTMT